MKSIILNVKPDELVQSPWRVWLQIFGILVAIILLIPKLLGFVDYSYWLPVYSFIIPRIIFALLDIFGIEK
jgi:hypothetical protein